jgi:acetylornithine/succinyldiaminopimelate/putrescine aminotransferase
MKNFAVITNSQRDFNVFKLENKYSGTTHNFIQVQTIEDVYKNQFNDYVNKSNSVKMPNINAIIKAVENNISVNE